MSVKAKCHNFTGCLLAYRGEEIELPAQGAMVCPECGKSVTVVHAARSAVGKVIAALVVLGALGAGVYFALPYLGRYVGKKSEVTESTPVPVSGTPRKSTTVAPSASPDRIVTASEPPAAPVAPAVVDLNVKKDETKNMRDEVLLRIDKMPNISQINKDKLYNSVQRARSMGLIVTIPFTAGEARIAASDIPLLKSEIEKPQIAKLRDDPTAVFVILGYADPKGDEKKNLAISQTRADSVLSALRDKCGVANIMHAVAMGGSKLIDPSKLEKNRVVEVWVALP